MTDKKKKKALGFKIGKVSHYYDKIGVAIVDLTSNLAKGDVVKFARGGEDMFEQKVGSIQIEHKKVDSAKSGDVVGLKVDETLKEGTEVYKVE